MDCPACGAPTVVFAVPDDLRAHAPADATALCTRCLRTHPAPDDGSAPAPQTADFSAIGAPFPDGRAGVAMALLVGQLDSLALHRQAIAALADAVEAAGGDVFLTLDRLADTATAGDLDPHADLARRRDQLFDLL